MRVAFTGNFPAFACNRTPYSLIICVAAPRLDHYTKNPSWEIETCAFHPTTGGIPGFELEDKPLRNMFILNPKSSEDICGLSSGIEDLLSSLFISFSGRFGVD